MPQQEMAIDGIEIPIPICVETGIQVHVREMQSTEALNTVPFKKKSPTLRAAISLRYFLSSDILPPDEKNVGKVVLNDKQLGPELPMQVCVGKKP